MMCTDSILQMPRSRPQHSAVSENVPSAAEADQQVCARIGLPEAAVLLDEAALSQLLGQPVQMTHMRLKPGRSCVIAWADRRSQAGWTTLTHDPDKFYKSLHRAERFGHPITVHQDQGPYLVSGSMWADPNLAKELDDARSALNHRAGGDVEWQILRYNPRRRVVAAVNTGSVHTTGATQTPQHEVIRVATGGTEKLISSARHWETLGFPVEHTEGVGHRVTAALTPLWGAGDLHCFPQAAAATSAGAAIAQVHSSPAEPPVDAGWPVEELATDSDGAAAAIGRIAPWLHDRAAALVEQLSPRLSSAGRTPSVLVHGDLSPDQVVVADPTSDEIRLIDLDRTGYGDPMRDLGSWAAACRRDQQLELLDPFISSYTATAGDLYDPMRLSAWEAYAHIAAATDPFRHRETEWPQRMTQAVTLAEEALQR